MPISIPAVTRGIFVRLKSCLVQLCLVGFAWQSTEAASRVAIEFREADSGRPTPALICLTGTDGEVRLPPDGRLMESPSLTQRFYRGIEYRPEPQWAGPVRKMAGVGDNNDRSYVYERRPSLPYWSAPVNYLVNERMEIELPAGRWRLAVDHGMEFVPVFREFETSGTGELRLRVDLERWIDLPDRGWWSGDVHVHHPTETEAQRKFLLAYARAADLHVVNVLEMGHHQGTDFPQAGFGKLYREVQGSYGLVSGQEDPRSTFGHIIGLNLTRMVRDLETYDFYDVTFSGIHRQSGALVGFAHFAWNGCDLPRGFPWYVTTGQLDFVELLQFGLLNQAGYYDYLNLGFRMAAAAGSDIPWGSSLGEVRTYVQAGPEFDLDHWFAGLAAGRTFVSNGPLVELAVDRHPPGSELKRYAGDRLSIEATARCHPAIGVLESLTLIGSQGILGETENSGSDEELQLELSHPVQRSQWITARAECRNGAIAHTSPVYVVIDGEPTWSPEAAPGIIARQLAAIARIKAEFDGKEDPRSRGIRRRLARARELYEAMLARLQSTSY